jgi:hypothetical protein
MQDSAQERKVAIASEPVREPPIEYEERLGAALIESRTESIAP